MSMSQSETNYSKLWKKDPYETELGKDSRERMEATGFYGATLHSPKPPPVVRAAKDGDSHALARFIQAEPVLAQFREQQQPQETLLHMAARGAHAAAVRVLVVGGADVSAVNCQSQDALSVLLTSTASEQALRETAWVLLDAQSRATPDSRPCTQLVLYMADLMNSEADVISDDVDAGRCAEEEELEQLRALVGAMWLVTAGADCSRLTAMLLPRLDVARDPAACQFARTLARVAGHSATERVLAQWLNHLSENKLPGPDQASYDPFPRQATYHLCACCLAWWVAPSDLTCPNCGTAGVAATKPRKSNWWPWGQAEASPPCIFAQEATVHKALWDLETRARRIAIVRLGHGLAARSNREQLMDRQLAEAATEVRTLQSGFQQALWAAEVVAWWNMLEIAVTDWDALDYEECGRRIEWCDALRARWRTMLRSWERQQTADQLSAGSHGETDPVICARQAVYSCGQIQQVLLEARAILAVRADGRAGKGGRLPAAPVEPFRTRVRATTDLSHRTETLGERLDRLGSLSGDSGL